MAWMRKNMYTLKSYFKGLETGRYSIEPDAEVKTLGSMGKCNYVMAGDSRITPIHLMLRFVEDHFEICPTSPCSINNQALPVEKWTRIPLNVDCQVSVQSYFRIDGQGLHKQPQELHFIDESPTQKGTSKLAFIDEAPTKKTQPKQQAINILEEEEIDTFSVKSKKEIDAMVEEIVEQQPEQQLPVEITGKTISDRYRILKKIGSGAMGEVYETWDDELKRKVALKLLNLTDMGSVAARRFIQEARSVGKLRHQNIVSVHDVGNYKGRPFFTMELLNGKDLKQKVEEAPISPRQAMTWVLDIANALQAVHDMNIVHRDIKSSNIIPVEHGAVLTDFGIAKDMGNKAQLTTAGETLGTPAYMPPEQAMSENEKINQTTDIYSLGAVLYELLTRKPPFEGTPVEVIHKVCTVDPIPIRKFNPEVNQDAVTIVMKALCKEQEYRYQSAREMAEDIDRYLNGEPILGEMPPFYLRLNRIFRSNKKVVISIAACLLFIVSFFVWKIIDNQQKVAMQRQLLLDKIEKVDQNFAKIKKQNKVSLQEFNQIYEDYSEILSQIPKNKEAIRGKFEVILSWGQRAKELGKLEFANALYSIGEEWIKEKKTIFDETDFARIEKERMKIQNLKQEKIQEEYKEAIKFLEEIRGEEVSSQMIKNTALSLLRFKFLQKLNEKHKGDVNENVRKTIQMAIAFQQGKYKKEDKASMTPIDVIVEAETKMIVSLLPQTTPNLQKKLLERLRATNSDEVQRFCTLLLGLTRYREASFSILENLQKNSSPRVKEASMWALSKLDGIKLFRSKLEIDPKATNFEKEIERRKNLILCLGYIGQEGLDIALEIFRQRENNLEKYKDEKFLKYFGSQERDVLRKIFRNLGKTSIPHLIREYENSQEDEKLYLLNTLITFRDPKVTKWIIEKTESPSERIKKAAFVALGKLIQTEGDNQDLRDRLLEVLAKALNDEHIQIKICALKIFRRLKLNEENRDKIIRKVLECIKKAFHKIRKLPKNSQDLKFMEELTQESSLALKAMGEAAITEIRELAQKEDGIAKLTYLQALARISPKEAFPLLVPLLYTSSQPSETKILVETFQIIGRSSLELLQKIFKKKRGRSAKEMRQARANILQIIGEWPEKTVLKLQKKCLFSRKDKQLALLAAISLTKKEKKGVGLLVEGLMRKKNVDIITEAFKKTKKVNILLEIYENPKRIAQKWSKRKMGLKQREAKAKIREKIAKILSVVEIDLVEKFKKWLKIKEFGIHFATLNIIKKQVEREKNLAELAEILIGFVQNYDDSENLSVIEKNQKLREKILALDILAQTRDKRAIQLFIKLLSDEVLKKHAKLAIRDFVDSQFIQEETRQKVVYQILATFSDKDKREGTKETLISLKKYSKNILYSFLEDYYNKRNLKKKWDIEKKGKAAPRETPLRKVQKFILDDNEEFLEFLIHALSEIDFQGISKEIYERKYKKYKRYFDSYLEISNFNRADIKNIIKIYLTFAKPPANWIDILSRDVNRKKILFDIVFQLWRDEFNKSRPQQVDELESVIKQLISGGKNVKKLRKLLVSKLRSILWARARRQKKNVLQSHCFSLLMSKNLKKSARESSRLISTLKRIVKEIRRITPEKLRKKRNAAEMILMKLGVKVK